MVRLFGLFCVYASGVGILLLGLSLNIKSITLNQTLQQKKAELRYIERSYRQLQLSALQDDAITRLSTYAKQTLGMVRPKRIHYFL